MGAQASRPCASGCCDAARKATQGRHILLSSKAREIPEGLHILAVTLTDSFKEALHVVSLPHLTGRNRYSRQPGFGSSGVQDRKAQLVQVCRIGDRIDGD